MCVVANCSIISSALMHMCSS
uniref:Uncharacterized protein n=1 Tax=Rhizophora mucronata TaxID=61149 RepID=A0A2P2PNK7_RHIMU